MRKIMVILIFLNIFILTPLCAQQIVLTHGWRSDNNAWENTKVKNYLVDQFGASFIISTNYFSSQRQANQLS